jgi:succinate dehydrogenase / fumarate reductase cytochrome b subunit
MSQKDRPLSPHLDVYRWDISNTLSILHRMTGVMLSIGALALVGWLVSVLAGYEAYSGVNAFFHGLFGGLLLLGWTFCFFYHLGNGIRHLFWDAGYGFDQQVARYTGWATFVAAVLFTLLFWWGVNS